MLFTAWPWSLNLKDSKYIDVSIHNIRGELPLGGECFTIYSLIQVMAHDLSQFYTLGFFCHDWCCQSEWLKKCVFFFIGPESDHALFPLVTNWLTVSLTHSVLFRKLDWCYPGVWRCQLKTCWGCYCCWCWCWGSCWQQFVTDLGAEVWS